LYSANKYKANNPYPNPSYDREKLGVSICFTQGQTATHIFGCPQAVNYWHSVGGGTFFRGGKWVRNTNFVNENKFAAVVWKSAKRVGFGTAWGRPKICGNNREERLKKISRQYTVAVYSNKCPNTRAANVANIMPLKGSGRFTKSVCMTNGKKGPWYKAFHCVFPFSYGGKTCNGPTCCNLDNDWKGNWCARSVNADGTMKKWGYCEDGC